MDLDASVLWDLAGEVVGRALPSGRSVLATVSRVDADGTVWVTTGDGMEAPAATSSVGVSVGDTVSVQWSGARMGVTGNSSDPSAGECAVGAVRRVAASAARAARGAKAIAEAVGQHFWADGNGVHVSTDPGDATGERNILMNSLGILLRQGATWLASFSDSAVAFYDGLGNTASNVLAQFGIVQESNPRTGQAQDMRGLDLGEGFGVRAGYTDYSGDTFIDAVMRAVRTEVGEGASLRLMASEAGGSARVDVRGPEASGEGSAQVGVATDDASVTVGYVDSGGYVTHGVQVEAHDGTSSTEVIFGVVGSGGAYADLDAVPWRNALGIRAGSVAALGNTAGGAYKDKSVSFGTELGSAFEFTSAPVVVVGFKSDSSAGTFGRCCVSAHSITTTGFTLRFFNGDSSNRNPEFYWIAIGTRASQL